MEEERIILTPFGTKLLSFLQKNDKVWVGKDLQGATGMKCVYFVLTSLIGHGLVKKEQPIERDFVNNKGVTLRKTYQTYSLTDKGRAFRDWQ